MTLTDRHLVLPTLALLSASALVLTGCAQGGDTTGGDRDDEPGTSEEAGGGGDTDLELAGPPCEENTGDFILGADPAVSDAPEYGQVWGDGSAFSLTYDDWDPASAGVLGYDPYYVQGDGGAIAIGGGFFPDPVGDTFTSNDVLFTSSADGYAGLVVVTLTYDTYVGDAGQIEGTTEELGTFCVTWKVGG